MKICLDAGHYGKYNRSPANPAYYESEAMWTLHLLQAKYLKEYGCEVIFTRDDLNKNKEVYDRGTAAKGCNLFISNHSNAVGDSAANESVDYPIVYVPISGTGTALGEKLAACVAETMGTKQKGQAQSKRGSEGDYYGVIRGATAGGAVGLLIEHSFHTNTRATNWLLDINNLDRLAKAEADVIARHYGLTPAPPPVPTDYATERINAAAWVVKEGISDGLRPFANATREEQWVMLYRFNNYLISKFGIQPSMQLISYQ